MASSIIVPRPSERIFIGGLLWRYGTERSVLAACRDAGRVRLRAAEGKAGNPVVDWQQKGMIDGLGFRGSNDRYRVVDLLPVLRPARMARMDRRRPRPGFHHRPLR
jgi:hypothetical protein